MNFDCAGSVTTLGRREVSRVEIITIGDSAAARAPRVALIKLIEVYLQIPETTGTPRVSVPCPREALYVHWMYRYLTGVAEYLSSPPVPIIVDLPQMRRDDHGVSNPVLRLISCY